MKKWQARVVAFLSFLVLPVLAWKLAAPTRPHMRTISSHSHPAEICGHLAEALASPEYGEVSKEDFPYFCKLPESAREAIPDLYWWPAQQYREFLRERPDQPQAGRNLGDKDDQHVSKLMDDPTACHFYSVISPSVVDHRVTEDERTIIVQSPENFIERCEALAARVEGGVLKPCGVIEMAGHSTQSVGLDMIFGIDYRNQNKVISPEPAVFHRLASCLARISRGKATVVMSTCGGEWSESDHKYHYWKKKAKAQEELATLLGLPVISGIGPVHGKSAYGPNGVEAVGGWHISVPAAAK